MGTGRRKRRGGVGAVEREIIKASVLIVPNVLIKIELQLILNVVKC